MIIPSPYNATTDIIKTHIEEIIEEISFLHSTQTSILRNDSYLVKDKDTQAVFESVLCKNQRKISINNHQKQFDIKHSNNKISIKSGVVQNDLLSLSYSRTTQFPTLDEKINYLSSFDNLILGIASEKIKNSNKNVLYHTKYYLYYFPADQIDLKNMLWTDNPNSYHGIDKLTNTIVDIKKKLSDQPWITLPTSNIFIKPLLETSIMIHNNRKYLIIDNIESKERSYFDIYEQRKKIKAIKGIKKCTLSTIKAVMD